MDTGDLNVIASLSAPVVNTLENNIVLNAFRIAVNGSLTQFSMVDGIVDEYEDESGIVAGLAQPFAHYKCNDNAASTVVIDNGTGANNGTSNVNTSNYSVVGKINEALEFNGSSEYIDIDNVLTAISSDTTGTFSLWLEQDSVASAYYPLSFGDTNSTSFFYINIDNLGRLNVALYLSGVYQWRHRTAAQDTYVIDTYYHIVVVQDGVSPKVYVDGADVTNFIVTIDTSAWFADVAGLDNGRIGCLNWNSGGNAQFYPGEIDDIRYYQNTALTSDQVGLLYNSGSGTEISSWAGTENASYDSVNDLYRPNKPTVSTSPFAHMKLENNTDEGTGANAVTNVGTPTYTAGKLNNALSLDGSTDALNLDALGTDISSDTAGSIAAWVNFTTASLLYTVCGFGDASEDSYVAIRINGTSGASFVQLKVADGGVDQLVYQTPSNSLAGGAWHHIVVTQDGVLLKIYIDGVNQSVTKVIDVDPTAWCVDAGTIDTGRLGVLVRSTTSHWLDGQIDDFRYYQNVVLTQSEIDAIYNSGTGTEDTNPEGTPENMTLLSDSFTAEVEADNGRIVLFQEDVDSVTLNTDLLAYASRDGGTTFTQITLVNEGEYETGKNILAASVDISAQPTGTTMQYKIVTANNKDLKIHGTGLSWD